MTPIKDPEIWRVARELLDYNATTALQAANKRAREAAEANDRETENVWLRIAKAVTELQKPTTN
jgi:hypothetical protein